MSFGEDKVRDALRQKQSANLAKARIVREQRGRLRRALRAEQLDPFAVIEGRADPDGLIESVVYHMKVLELLPMIRGVAKARAREIVGAMELDPLTRIRDLTTHQRRELSLVTRGSVDVGYVPPLRTERIPSPAEQAERKRLERLEAEKQ
jgi:ribosomal protein S13